MAVGVYAEFPPPINPANQTLIEEWKGSSWSIVSSPSPSQLNPNQPEPGEVGNYLNGVSCVDENFCIAVGYDYTASGPVTLVEQWDGTAWSLVDAPNPSSAGAFLNAVSCPTTTFCIAAGYQLVGSGYQTLVEQWNGSSWSVVPSPGVAGSPEVAFNGVSCTGTAFCMADGWDCSADGSTCSTFMAAWNGSSWTSVASPNTAAPFNYLYGMACASSTFCMAAGSTFTLSTNTSAPLFERWDGSTWSLAPFADPTAQSALLYPSIYGVACADSGSCMAVGNAYVGSVAQTLIEQWGGSDWSIDSSPDTGTTESNALFGAACAGNDFCMATGAYNTVSTPAGAISQTLIEEYTVPVQVVSVVSELTHGSAGTFHINLPLTGNPAIECRSSASLGAGNYTMVFTFVNNLIAVGSAGASGCGGSVSSSSTGPNANQYTVNLTGVSNACYISVTLSDVIDSAGNVGTVSAPMGVLIGDTTGDGFVNSADISQTKSQSGAAVTSSNFREDLNADGFINSADISLVKSQSGTALP